MEILEANAVPLSYDPPTPDEKMKSKELEAYLRLRSSLGLYETKDEVTHRQELLESLQNLVRESVKQILKNQVSLRRSDESRMHLQISRRRSWRTSSRLVRSEWASTSPVPISIRRVG